MTAVSESLFNERADEIRRLTRTNAKNIWRIGQLLTEVRDATPHGEFREWIKKEFDWERSTADNFMNVYHRFKSPNFGHLKLSVLYSLAAPSTPEAVRENAVARAEAGEEVTTEGARALKETYEETGKVPPLVEALTALVDKVRWERKNKAKPAATSYEDVAAEEENEEETPVVDRAARKKLLQEMKVNGERNARFFAVIDAIECLRDMPMTIPEVVWYIRRFDTPDKDWTHQIAGAIRSLEQLEGELNGTTTDSGNPGGNPGSVGRDQLWPNASGDRVG